MKKTAEALGRYFQGLYPANEPGFGAAVLLGGKVVFQKAYGLANLETKEPLSTRSLFNIGSNSKLFTGALIQLLESEGKLKVLDPILKYFPNLPGFLKPVRLRHLLNHSSGLAATDGYKIFGGFDWEKPDPPHLTDWAVLSRMTCLQAKPGTEWAYNNFGFVLLARVIEKVSKRPYDDVVRQRLFVPLGMVSARRETEAGQRKKEVCLSYTRASKTAFRPMACPLIEPGPTHVMCSVEDMANFVKSLRDRGPMRDLFQRMVKGGWKFPEKGHGYSSGIEIGHRKNLGAIYFHGGVHGGFHSNFFWIPKFDFGMVLLGNRQDFWPWAHFDRVIEIALGLKASRPGSGPPANPKKSPASVPLEPGFYRPLAGRELWELKRGKRKGWTVTHGRGEFKIQPWSQGMFRGRAAAARSLFIPHAHGKNGVALSEYIEGKKLKTMVLMRSEAARHSTADFRGVYHCELTASRYRVALQGPNLRLAMPDFATPETIRKNGRFEVMGTDRFVGTLFDAPKFHERMRAELVFRRGKWGKIKGFRLEMLDEVIRLRELEFERE